MKYFIVIILGFSLFSCEKELTIDDSNFESEVVVNSILSSDSTLNVNLSYSSFITDPTIRYVSDAQVFITNLNTQEEYKLEHDRKGNYVTDVVAYKSNDYALSVITFDGNEMTSETSVPRDILVDVSIDTLYDINSDFSELSLSLIHI